MTPTPIRLPEYQHHRVATGGGEIHVAELPGNGPAMLLLHGIGMDWRVWQAVSRRLHPHFRLLILDLRGHGDSAKPDRGYSLAHYAADVEDVLDILRISGAVLVGSSLGGMVATAVEAPSDIITHRVLVDPPLTGGPIRDAAKFRTILRLKDAPLPDLATFLEASDPGAGHFMLTTMAEMWRRTSDGVLTEILAHPDTFFAVDANLASIAAPVLIMQADTSLGGVLDDEHAARALALLAAGLVVRVAGAGHAIHAQQPVRFVELLLDFCRPATTTAQQPSS